MSAAAEECTVLDELDLEIVKALGIDPRQSARQIAINLEVAEGTVRTRIRRLVETNAIRITVVNDSARQKNPTLAVIWVRLERAADSHVVTEKIASLEDVVFVSAMVGISDLLVMTFVKDAAALSQLVHGSLDAIPGVGEVQYSLCGSLAKDDYLFQPYAAKP